MTKQQQANKSVCHKQLTAHIRKRIKVVGVNARVKMGFGNEGRKTITVCVPHYDARFTEEGIYQICHIAECNKLTYVRGLPIQPTIDRQLTGKTQFDFYIPAQGA